MYQQKDYELVEKLIASTEAGKMDWSPTAEPNMFTTGLSGKYSVLIKESRAGEPAFVFRIADEQGTVIHRLNSNEYPNLEGLYELARRRALKVDAAIDNIIKDLDSQN